MRPIFKTQRLAVQKKSSGLLMKRRREVGDEGLIRVRDDSNEGRQRYYVVCCSVGVA